jgi:hypothetical protein
LLLLQGPCKKELIFEQGAIPMQALQQKLGGAPAGKQRSNLNGDDGDL